MSNKIIRVLQISLAASEGGRTQYILNLWKHIDKTKFLFDFVTFSSHELSCEKSLKESGPNVYHIDCYPENNEELFIEEFNSILNNGYDVIHIATSFWKNTIIERLAKEAGVPKIIVHSHSTGIVSGACNINQALLLHNEIKASLSNEYMRYDRGSEIIKKGLDINTMTNRIEEIYSFKGE